jgi:uncharacterized RDD family membrane protein YckC
VAITVLKNNVPWGPFSRGQIRDGLIRGDFTLQYLAHAPGLKEWLPLGEVLDYFDRGTTLPPIPAVPPVPGPRDLPALPGTHEAPASNAPLPALPASPSLLVSPMSPGPPALPVPDKRPPEISSITPKAPAVPVLPPVSPPTLRPASFFPRFFAFVIDCLVLFGPIVFLFGVGALTIQIQGWVEHLEGETMHEEWGLLWRDLGDLLLLVALGGAWIYAAMLECSRWQATVGKQWAGIKVTDRYGERLSFFRATGRHVAKCVSALPCFLGFAMACFSSRGLALHDWLAGTRVLRK